MTAGTATVYANPPAASILPAACSFRHICPSMPSSSAACCIHLVDDEQQLTQAGPGDMRVPLKSICAQRMQHALWDPVARNCCPFASRMRLLYCPQLLICGAAHVPELVMHLLSGFLLENLGLQQGCLSLQPCTTPQPHSLIVLVCQACCIAKRWGF